MKKIKFICFLSVILFFFSCENKDAFLDKPPLSYYTGDIVWNNLPLIESFVGTIYHEAVGKPFAIIRLSDLSDESFFPPDWDVSNFNKCLINAHDLAGWGSSWSSPQTVHFLWENMYANVRRTNLFFENINVLKTEETDRVTRLKGEVYFLRAWTYASLVAMYGGVPIITRAYGLNDDFSVPRNTYDECIRFITGQLDSAAICLPLNYADASNQGRATKGAALALKSRVLLYAASDLHNPQKNSIVTTAYSNPELLGYISGDPQQRWQMAKDAAKDVIDLGKYDLFKADPMPEDSVAKNITDYFLSGETLEDIFLQYFSASTNEDWNGYNPALYCGPDGYHCWGNNTPLEDLVDEYEMKDGSRFDWTDPTEKTSPYSNREARFYATILYEGASWRQRPADNSKQDPFNRIQVGRLEVLNQATLKVGLDSKQGPISSYNGTISGYFLRKYVDPSIDPTVSMQYVPFRHLRYAEILLNYAEACIELGQNDEARIYINKIRKRAGQPDLSPSLTGEALRQAYRHERRIEMAFEDQRFWDIRRWMIGPEGYHQTHHMQVRYYTETTSDEKDYSRFFIPPGGYTGARSDGYLKHDGSTWSAPNYNVFAYEYRSWNNKCYFFPILYDELTKNKKLVQNPQYEYPPK